MVHAITYAREKKIPFFGICLGMQCATIEYARQVSGARTRGQHRIRSRHAQSRDLQIARTARRGRNGRHDAPGRVALQARAGFVRAQSLRHTRKFPSATAIATNSIASTRRRSPAPAFASPAARRTASTSRSSKFPTIPWFVGCQFHPEFKSKPLAPHPLFAAFIRASLENRRTGQGVAADKRITTADPAAD